jgi:hypothetical protein
MIRFIGAMYNRLPRCLWPDSEVLVRLSMALLCWLNMARTVVGAEPGGEENRSIPCGIIMLVRSAETVGRDKREKHEVFIQVIEEGLGQIVKPCSTTVFKFLSLST